ncbi:RING/FYVE/PHD zinc finger superfamily protein [Striga asiatica]|uniref:RING/FYVE/PHD zinc finger superfamily protein n=1 Tax=Striga asiatica TaxID=4170 RepID=A0A5A7PR72_STRAF|nr:RING/FYVE/PHD zinc finger superfamily protein [Striga asiatica]
MGGEHSDSSPLVAPMPAKDPSEIDLEAGPDEQIQCRICLETDGRDFIAPCKCKGTSKYVHRECLDHWRAVKVISLFAYLVYLIDGYQKFWLRLTCGFDSEISFYYICVYVPTATCLALSVCGLIVPRASKVVPARLANVVALGVPCVSGHNGRAEDLAEALSHTRQKDANKIEDVDGEMTGGDWSPPALPSEHVQQLKGLGLLDKRRGNNV